MAATYRWSLPGYPDPMPGSHRAARRPVTWRIGMPDHQERVLNTENGIETVEARLPISGGEKGFIRLSYRQAPDTGGNSN